MTIPRERANSIKQARHFLRQLLNPKATPGVPRAVRTQASWVLRHFPGPYDMERVAAQLPDLFEENKDDQEE